ncbi:hypothetical protein [Tuwongella immobilis]|uniref:Uncharacterized protein n=1 Tax=Tuwongella immobilis TaxID=692036 RepID=A0A6C2YJ18_9BACT|nr:hypothetical protein [Tuwongella immobilis]VIP01239.1 unnamed protein product [Tuwongella immobilis]VTR97904.1 unnamed protein product [Tuwongella immobilis]
MIQPQAIVFALGCAAVIAWLGIVWIGWNWKSIGRSVNELGVKIAAAIVKLVAAIASVGGTYAASQKEAWWLPVIVGLFCLFSWEFLEKLVDNRVKAMDRLDKQALQTALSEVKIRTELLTIFRKSVVDKLKRLLQKLSNRRKRSSLPVLRSALIPEQHLTDILTNLGGGLSAQLPEDAKIQANFRLAIFVAREGQLHPRVVVDLNHPGEQRLASCRTHPERFCLSAEGAVSHAVLSIRQRKHLIVEDCLTAAETGTFFYFEDAQKQYLASLVANYLGEVIDEDGQSKSASLVIDTNTAGFFRDENRISLEFCLREFATRIKLELALHAMLSQRGAKS